MSKEDKPLMSLLCLFERVFEGSFTAHKKQPLPMAGVVFFGVAISEGKVFNAY